MLAGTVQWTVQERVVHGKPAAEAVPAEIERIGAKRVLLLTTHSLTKSRLIRGVTSALGDRCVGRFGWCSIRPYPLGGGLALRAMAMLAGNLPAIKRPDR